MNSLSLTAQFVEQILAVEYRLLPDEAIDMARQVTLDGLAVMLAGATEPLGVGRIATEYVREMGGAPQASVIAGGFKTSMLNAAYANGTMAHALDYEDTFDPALMHPNAAVAPAALAIAESLGNVSGRELIAAIATAAAKAVVECPDGRLAYSCRHDHGT